MALTKAAAKAITADLDRLAQLFEKDHAALGVPNNVATDFAYRCDILSDFVEKRGGLDRNDSVQKTEKEVDVSHQPDEPYMATKTKQDELYELGQMVEKGGLGKAALEQLAGKVAELLKASADDDDDPTADDDDDDATADDDDGDDADKKAHLINLANNLLRLAGDDDDDDDAATDDDDDADEDEDADADEDEGKTAFAHGYRV
ncbi:MAG: hypothetical protein NZ659_15605 [Acidimicrobiales bacterium]|nr:hypothetical protein [Acidimicrobiales bacterium]